MQKNELFLHFSSVLLFLQRPSDGLAEACGTHVCFRGLNETVPLLGILLILPICHISLLSPGPETDPRQAQLSPPTSNNKHNIKMFLNFKNNI